MSTNYRRDWFNNSNIYYKAAYHDPYGEKSPNSAIETINHFSKPRLLLRYPNPEGYKDNGFAKKGNAEEIEFWCFILTLWAGRKEEAIDTTDAAGTITEGTLAVYYNPYHRNHPREGIHLHVSNPRSLETMDYSGFADVLSYNGLLWKVTSHNSYDVSYDTGKEYIGKATIERYAVNSVTDSSIDTDHNQRFIYNIK